MSRRKNDNFAISKEITGASGLYRCRIKEKDQWRRAKLRGAGIGIQSDGLEGRGAKRKKEKDAKERKKEKEIPVLSNLSL